MNTLMPLAALGSALVILAVCGDNQTTNPPPDDTIQLSSAQAATIRTRVGQLATANPELAWLADSIRLIVSTGVEAVQVPITTSLGDGPAGSCSTVENGPDVTCNPAMLNVSFTVSDAQPEGVAAAGRRSASLGTSVVSRIIIRMMIH